MDFNSTFRGNRDQNVTFPLQVNGSFRKVLFCHTETELTSFTKNIYTKPQVIGKKIVYHRKNGYDFTANRC